MAKYAGRTHCVKCKIDITEEWDCEDVTLYDTFDYYVMCNKCYLDWGTIEQESSREMKRELLEKYLGEKLG